MCGVFNKCGSGDHRRFVVGMVGITRGEGRDAYVQESTTDSDGRVNEWGNNQGNPISDGLGL